MPAVVESTTSTPNSGSLAMESSNASSADKKRNKLGYHRTSVACVHCRRRKIRCLVAADDAQGRCENCIRLRKECHFFPVDQQPPVEKRSRPGSKLETPASEPSQTSPSPQFPGTVTTEQGESFYPYPPMPLTSGQDMAAFNAPSFAGTPVSSFSPDASIAPEFAAAQPLDPSVPWEELTTISDPNLLASMAGKPQMASPSPVYFAPGGAAVAPPLASNSPMPAPTVPGQPHMISSSPAFTIQPDGSVWPMQPARSMTLSAPTELPSQYPNHFPQQMHPDFKRRMTSPVQPMGQMAGSPMHNTPSPSLSEMQAAQIPVTYANQQAVMGFQTWHGMPGVAGGNYTMYPAEPLQTDFGGQAMGHPGQRRSPPP
ncbi:transcriptional regulator family: Fungal Specific TF [Paecilomyces variotii]|nr:transcriptional regulator family: Fungal Specific TF [Paecilomyces variotii]